MKVEHDYPVPKLAPGGVLVKNKYRGINFIDTTIAAVCTSASSLSSAARRAAASSPP